MLKKKKHSPLSIHQGIALFTALPRQSHSVLTLGDEYDVKSLVNYLYRRKE